MADRLCTRFTLWSLWLLSSACAGPPIEIPDDSRVSLTVARDVGRLRLQVSVSEHCGAYERCPSGKPIERVQVNVRTADDTEHKLGLTGNGGWLEVPYTQLDGLFAVETTGSEENAPVVVGRRVVAHLPVGEIVHRHEVVASYINQAEEILALSQDDFEGSWWHYSQDVLSQMIDLQMRGEANAELVSLTQRLHERIRKTDKETWFGERWWNNLVSFFHGDDSDVPDDLKEHVQNASHAQDLEDTGLGVPLEYLPTICTVSVVGGGVAMSPVVTGVGGATLALVAAIVGNTIKDSLIDSCCKIASETLTGTRVTECPDNIRS